MSNDQTKGEGVTPPLSEIEKLLAETTPDRAALNESIGQLFSQFWYDVLCMVEEIYPYRADDPRTKDFTPEKREANAQLFTAYRFRVLRTGNQKKTEAGKHLECCAIRRLIERQTVTRTLPQSGPWGLPAGVKMRTRN